MPPPKHRKKPFSAKQKKEQLKAKRERKRQKGSRYGSDSEDSGNYDETEAADVKRLNEQPVNKDDKSYDPNRYRLHFLKESRSELERRKALAQQPYQTLPEEALEVDMDDIYKPGSVLDMPKRPRWDYSMTKEQLEAKEEAYFKEYLEKIMSEYKPSELSYFELNLETWRQQWRVLEMADIVLLITDIRHPALHFSPALYHYVTKELNKAMIVVLNKVDLAPAALVVAWRYYFREKFPDIRVVYFTSFPKEKTKEDEVPGTVLHKRRQRRAFSAIGPKQLLMACQDIVKTKVDLLSWQEKIEGEIAGVDTEHEVEVRMEELPYDRKHIPYRDGVLTIGCCGYPNVGKSSLMNGLMGRKVVSVSRTPGHTKHFQTIYLTPTVKLCDSPGLVFPSLVTKPMQILAGIYPVAQVREPYSAVQYLAERVPLPQLLHIRHPEDDKGDGTKEYPWSAFDICDAWAQKRGFLTAKAARHDAYRAANNILRLAVDGRICLCTRPPGYTKQKAEWEIHPDTLEVNTLKSLNLGSSGDNNLEGDLDLETDEKDSDNEATDEDEDEDEDGERGQASMATNNPFALLSGDV